MNENIDVTVDLRNALSRPAAQAEESIEDLGDEVDQLNAKMKANRAEQARMRRQLKALQAASGAATVETEKNTKATDKNTAAKKKASDAARRLKANEDAATASSAKATKVLRKMASVLKMVLIADSVVLVVLLLASAVSALGAAAFAGVAGLSPLVGLFGVIPGVVLTAVTALAAAKLSVFGLGDALKALAEGDPQKSAAALAKLTDEGRVLALTLDRLSKGPLQDVKEATQSAIAPGLVRALRELRPLFPVLQRGLARTAGTLGDLAAEGAAATNTPFFRDRLSGIMLTNDRSLRNGARAAGIFGMAMLGIADAFRPVQAEMSRYLLRGAEFVRQQVEMGVASGGLRRFFKDAWELAKGVGRVLSDVAVALYNIGVESDVMGKMLGGSIEGAAARWREWTESVEGKNAIRDWFAEATPVVAAFGSLLTTVAAMFGGLSSRADLTPLLEQIESELLPALSDLGNAVSSDIGPALVVAATAAVKFVTALSGSPVVEILLAAATAVEAIADGFLALPGPVRTVLLGLLAVAGVMRAFSGSKVESFFSTLGTNAKSAGAKIYGASQQASGFGRITAGAFAGARAAAGGLIGALGGPWGLAIAGATVALGLFASAQAKAKQKQAENKALVDELTASLDQQTGALTRVTRETVFNKLYDDGVFDAARELGLSLDTVTDAALGNKEALEAVNAVTSPYLDTDGLVDPKIAEVLAVVGENAQTVADAVGETSGAVGEAKTRQSVYNEVMATGASRAEDFKTAVDKAAEGSRGAAGGSRDAAGALNAQANAADRTRRAVVALNDELIGQKRTYLGFRQSVADAADTLNKNKKTLNQYSQAGRDNMNALLDLAEAASAVENRAQRTKAIEEAKTKIAAWADAAGYGTKEAKRFADGLFVVKGGLDKLPKDKKTSIQVVGLDGVRAKVDELFNGINRLNDKKVTITTVFNEIRDNLFRRDGGPVWGGQDFRVGEVGPELLVNSRGISVIGEGGPVTRQFDEPGMVLPNEFFRAMAAGDSRAEAEAAGVQRDEADRPLAMVGAPAAAAGSSSGRGDLEQVPHIHNHFDGDTNGLTPADIEAASLRAWRKFQRESRERG